MNRTALFTLIALPLTAISPAALAACPEDVSDNLYRKCMNRQVENLSEDLERALLVIENLEERVDQINTSVMNVQDTLPGLQEDVQGVNERMVDLIPDPRIDELLEYVEVNTAENSLVVDGLNVYIQAGDTTDLGNLMVEGGVYSAD